MVDPALFENISHRHKAVRNLYLVDQWEPVAGRPCFVRVSGSVARTLLDHGPSLTRAYQRSAVAEYQNSVEGLENTYPNSVSAPESNVW